MQGIKKREIFICLFNYFVVVDSNRPPSPNTLRKQQAPMNPASNSFAIRDAPPPPPLRPNAPPNAFGGNSAGGLPAPIIPQYVIIYYHLSFFFAKNRYIIN